MSAGVISSFLVALVVVDVRGLDLEVSLGPVSPFSKSTEGNEIILVIPIPIQVLLSLHSPGTILVTAP